MSRPKVLIVAPHPDDETLGCGGTILKHKSAGDIVDWLIITNIIPEEEYSTGKYEERQVEIDSVANEYSFDDVFKLDFSTTMLDSIPNKEIIEAVCKVIYAVKPNIIYIPYRNDVHSDHKATFDAVISSIKTFRCPSAKRVLMYEVLSETEFAPALQNFAFSPNSFSDISGYFEKKMAIMKIYKGELGEHPFPRSEKNLKALATFRGATAGVKYAEAFMVLKEIW